MYFITKISWQQFPFCLHKFAFKKVILNSLPPFAFTVYVSFIIFPTLLPIPSFVNSLIMFAVNSNISVYHKRLNSCNIATLKATKLLSHKKSNLSVGSSNILFSIDALDIYWKTGKLIARYKVTVLECVLLLYS